MFQSCNIKVWKDFIFAALLDDQYRKNILRNKLCQLWDEVWVDHSNFVSLTSFRLSCTGGGQGREEGEDGRAYLFLMMPALFFFFLHRGRQFVFGENLLSDASFCFSVSQVDASILGPWKCGRGRSSVSVCMCVLEREREKEEDRRRAAGSISTGIQSAVFLIQAVCWAFAPHLPFKRHPIPS